MTTTRPAGAMGPGLVLGLAALLLSGLWFRLEQPMPARCGGVLLALGALAAGWWGVSGGWGWRRPLPWLLAALALLLAGWTWTTVPGPAVFRLVERAAALATVCGVAGWCLRSGAGSPAAALGALGASLLVIDVVGQVPLHGTTLGLALGLGLDPPFGNTNFTSGAALPLLAVGLLAPQRTWGHLAILALGVAAALVLGCGLLNGDANRAALVGLLAIVGMAGILRLPARSHGPLLATATLIGLGLWAWLLIDAQYPALLGPSTGFRIGVWRAALAAWTEHPFLGHGPAASLTALNRQDEYQMAWLAVPGYAEHAHSEPLEMLVEGGALLAGLLAVATVLLLQPLWRQREVHGGLLAGWAVAAVMACLESHYGQPGPLFCLAVLAGATLAAGTTAPASPEPTVRALGVGVTLAVLLSIVWEFRWTVDGRTGHAAPPLVEVLGRRRLETERTAKEWPAVERRAARMQEELGPLTDLWFVQAEAAARQGRTRDALALTLRQARTGPLLPGHLELCDRLRIWARKHQDQEAMAALDRARTHARDLILRGQALGWRGKDQAMVTWLEAWAARQDADHSSPRASSPSSP